MIAEHIFKNYDIRGVYGTELTDEVAYRVGRALVTFLGVSEVVVGHDMRKSSPAISKALMAGIMDQGANVVDIGLCSTPMLYWTVQSYPAGVMITASHNPGQYNGLKMCKGAMTIGEINGMFDIKRLALENNFSEPAKKGSYKKIDVLLPFLRFSLSILNTKKPFKIVVDAGNGMGGFTYGELMQLLPANIQLVPMFFEPDGAFPNHEANPLKTETLRALQKKVIEEEADLGMALDGDDDRIVFVDNEGQPVHSDYTVSLLIQQILTEKPEGTVLYNVVQSRIVPEMIRSYGGISIMVKVGHTNIKHYMREYGAVFAGDHSGHYYNSEQSNTENTMIILFRLLNYLSTKESTFAQLVAPLRAEYAKIEETNFEVSDPKSVVDQLRGMYSKEAWNVSNIDGVRIDFEDWWFNVRPSNTEPLLRLNMEARNTDVLSQKLEELKVLIIGEKKHEDVRVGEMV